MRLVKLNNGVLFLLLAACAGLSQPRAARPILKPRSFAAVCVDCHGAPHLSAKERMVIRQALREVSPAARRLVRYTFSGGEGRPKTVFTVFLDDIRTPQRGATRWLRVLNAPSCNLFYNPDAGVTAAFPSC